MPTVDMSFEHGQDLEDARANFERGIAQARARFGMFIRRIDWAEDRMSARLAGQGFDITLRLDAAAVHVAGSVAIFPRLLEGPVRKFLGETFRGDPKR